MEGVSCKSLWTLVSGEGLKTEKGLIKDNIKGLH